MSKKNFIKALLLVVLLITVSFGLLVFGSRLLSSNQPQVFETKVYRLQLPGNFVEIQERKNADTLLLSYQQSDKEAFVSLYKIPNVPALAEAKLFKDMCEGFFAKWKKDIEATGKAKLTLLGKTVLTKTNDTSKPFCESTYNLEFLASKSELEKTDMNKTQTEKIKSYLFEDYTLLLFIGVSGDGWGKSNNWNTMQEIADNFIIK